MKKIALLSLLFFALTLIMSSGVMAAQQEQQQPMGQQGQQQGQQQEQEQPMGQQGQQQQAQQQQPRDQMDRGNLKRAEELKGMTVRNAQGEELATVQDAIVNTQNGRIEYIVLQSGGLAGVGGKMIPVPINAFQVTKDRRLVLNITSDRLEAAPVLEEAQWPPANESKWAQSVRSYFSKQVAQAKQQRQTGTSQQTQPTPMGKE
jgi:sporulation protein YlmC with PRC-barrel domain